MDARLLTSVGLLVDIAGAVWMALGLMRLRDVDISNASVRGGFGGGTNRSLIAIRQSSRRDARLGGTLLVLGFAIQLVATWLPR